MSTTLTNGLKLPDKGSVDWYVDMQNNYTILDGAVGTVAEHTTQIAGKAPLVHTHTKSDITDFPTYGNAAGTICEGNDSRLSDARTPVAHTHGKADITDLFNSANTWSNGNSFQHFISLNGDRNAYIVPMWAGAASGMSFLVMDATKQFVFGQRTTDANNRYVYDPTKGFLVIRTGETGGGNYVEVIPYGSDTRLGDSANKWTTFNGINPGALSLPDTLGTSGTENVNYFNVIGYLNNTGTLATIPSTATYDGWLYINAKDGIDSYIIIDDSPSSFGTSVFGNNGLGAYSIGLLCLMCPIRKGHSYTVRIKSAGIVSARIYPAQGNV